MVLINAEGHIFAGKRLDNNTDAWQMPQGGIDEGETPEAAAFRELSEETGIHHSKARLLEKPKTGYLMTSQLILFLNFGADDIEVKNKNGLPSSFLGKIQI